MMFIPSAELSIATHPLRYIQPPRSLCLLKRLRRADTAAVLSSVNVGAPVMRPPTFVIPFTPLSRIIPTRDILLERWPLVRTVIDGLPPPIIAYRSCISFVSLLIHVEAKSMEKKRTAGRSQKKLKQTELTFRRLPLNASILPASTRAYKDGPADMDLSSQ